LNVLSERRLAHSGWSSDDGDRESAMIVNNASQAIGGRPEVPMDDYLGVELGDTVDD
jgi:hypothetical protein